MSHSAAPSPLMPPSSITVDAMPSGLDVDPSTNLVFVDGQQNGTLTIIDGTTGSIVVNAMKLNAASPHGVSVNPSTHTAFVAEQGSDCVSVVAQSSGVWSVTTVSLAANSQPHGVAANAETNFLYVANQGNNNMSVIDTSLDPPAEIAGSPFGVGANPHGIGVDPVANLVFVANRKDGTVSVFSGATRNQDSVTPPSCLATVTVGASSSAPTGIGVNPALSNAYVSLSGDNAVVALNYGGSNSPSDPALTTISNVGSAPDRFCVNTDSNVVYVSDNGGSQVTAIDSSNTVVGSVTVGTSNPSAPTEMGYLPATGCVYVAVQNDNVVAVVKASSFTGGSLESARTE